MGRAHGDQGLRVPAHQVRVEAGAVKDCHPLNDVFHEVEGDHCAHVPVKFG